MPRRKARCLTLSDREVVLLGLLASGVELEKAARQAGASRYEVATLSMKLSAEAERRGEIRRQQLKAEAEKQRMIGG